MAKRKQKLEVALTFKSQQDALEYLREKHPKFFQDDDSRGIAAIIIKELGQELSHLTPLSRATTIATIMTFMYRMASAAMESANPKGRRGMSKIFIADWLKQNENHSH